MTERLATSRLAAAPAGPHDATDSDRAGLPPRILAYVLDSVVLFGFTMLFAAFAGLNMYIRTDSGQEGISSADEWTSIGIFMAVVPAWLVLMTLVTYKRGQTLGQYVMGLRIVSDDGTPASLRRMAAYWLAFHPLFFHPMFGMAWLLLAWGALLSEAVFIVSLALALLCVLVPLANLVFAVIDPQRRAIHDRLAGLRVVRLE